MNEGLKTNAQIKPGELAFTTLLLLTSLIVGFYAYGISGFTSISAPGSVPMLAAMFMIISAVFTFASTLNKHLKNTDQSTRFTTMITPPTLIFFSALSLVYILIINQLGFLISSSLFLFVSILSLYRKGPLLACLISINTLAVIYIIFRVVFKVILPEANLWL